MKGQEEKRNEPLRDKGGDNRRKSAAAIIIATAVLAMKLQNENMYIYQQKWNLQNNS